MGGGRGGGQGNHILKDCSLNFVVNCEEISILHLGRDGILSYHPQKIMHTVCIPDKQYMQ